MFYVDLLYIYDSGAEPDINAISPALQLIISIVYYPDVSRTASYQLWKEPVGQKRGIMPARGQMIKRQSSLSSRARASVEQLNIERQEANWAYSECNSERERDGRGRYRGITAPFLMEVPKRATKTMRTSSLPRLARTRGPRRWGTWPRRQGPTAPPRCTPRTPADE